MSKPKKEPTPPEKPGNLKDAIRALLKLSPNHPLHAVMADPENVGRTWIVELVMPPGCFVARSIPEPVDMDFINVEIEEAFQAMKTGEPLKNRYILFVAYSGAQARRIAGFLAEDIPEPSLPLSPGELFDLDSAFHTQ